MENVNLICSILSLATLIVAVSKFAFLAKTKIGYLWKLRLNTANLNGVDVSLKIKLGRSADSF